ncbi:MAG: hypothetical protein OK442_02445 [Thaumarchaeota archaeon]|nr:hypothetical protein [Nitrososphaerota archaeon]
MRKRAITFLAVAVVLSLMVVSFAIYLSPRTSEVACVSTVYLAFLGNATRSSVGTYTTTTNSTAPVGRVMSTTLTPFSEGKQLYRIEETCTFVSK